MRSGLAALVSLFLVLALPARGGHDDRRFERVGESLGLAESSVRCIVQDRQGFVWLAGDEGLIRFDGRATRVFRHQPGSTSGLGSNRISRLLVDSEGTLWVGTRGGGLARFDRATERFETFRSDPGDPASLSGDDIADLVEDARGRLWIATWRGGLNVLDRKAGGARRFRRFVHTKSEPGSLADDRLRCLLIDREGTLWVGTMSGVDRLADEATGRFVHYRHDDASPDSLRRDEVWSLLRDRSGALWVGTWGGGLARLGPEAIDVPNGRFTSFGHEDASPFSLSDNRVMSLLEDRAGTIWVGTLDGLNELLPAESRSDRPRFLRHRPAANEPHRLGGSDVFAAFEDRDGDLWFGTGSGGVSRLDRSHEAFSWYQHDPDDPGSLSASDEVTAALEDRSGVLWVGTSKGLDRVIPPADRFGKAVVTHFRDDPANPDGFRAQSVSTLLEDHQGTLWIGTIGGGLNALTADQTLAEKPRFRRLPYEGDDPTALTSREILSLHEDERGTLWVGTYRGLNRAVRGDDGWPVRFVRSRNDRADPESLSADTIQSLASDPVTGALWVGTYRGLNRLDVASGCAVRYLPDARRPGTLSHEFVYDVSVDDAGRPWAATWGGGVARLEADGRFTVWGVSQGLPSETVRAMARDPRGRLWLATSRGLSRLDPRTGAVTTLAEPDGLLSARLTALAFTRDGRLLAGGFGGLTIFRPEAVERGPGDAGPPPVALTELRLQNRTVAIGASALPESLSTVKEIVLRHTDYLFALEFAALSYRLSERVTYAYRLEPFDADWVTTGAADRKAVYSGVPPGRYVFRVKARSSRGLWNEDGASLRVTILPPWWGTWWARAAALLLVVLAAAAWPAVRLARARRLTALLEARVHERTAALEKANVELDAANRAKSVFLASMSHELRTPLNGILGFSQLMDRRPGRDAEDRAHLRTILRSGEHLLGLINDVLSLSKIEAGGVSLDEKPFELPALLRGLEDMLRMRADAKGLTLTCDWPPDLPTAVIGDEGKLRQILINLLGNAVKFTAEGTVSLRASWADDRGTFEVEDTGPGIAEEELGKLFTPFQQTETGRQSREGTGLGLSISREFARLMGGDITVSSVRGRGTTFRLGGVRLPRVAEGTLAPDRGDRRRVLRLAPRAGSTSGLAGPGDALRADDEPPRILVVDDVAQNRVLLVKLLEPVGFSVREARSGAEAVDVWRAWAPHLVLMDKRMPGMDGLQATRAIRAAEAASGRPRVAIVALSASALEHERGEILASGCDDFVAKPFREGTLFAVLAERLSLAYEYEDPEPVAAPAEAGLDAARLRTLPVPLRDSLRKAIEAGDFLAAEELAESVRTSDAALADELLAAVRSFRFDELLAALGC